MLPGDRLPAVPGGKDVLYEALRQRETVEFFAELNGHLAEAERLRGPAGARRRRRDPGTPGRRAPAADARRRSPARCVADLTVDGLPRIFDSATIFLTPWFAPYIGAGRSAELAEWLARVVISYFLVALSLSSTSATRRRPRDFVDAVRPALRSTRSRSHRR